MGGRREERQEGESSAGMARKLKLKSMSCEHPDRFLPCPLGWMDPPSPGTVVPLVFGFVGPHPQSLFAQRTRPCAKAREKRGGAVTLGIFETNLKIKFECTGPYRAAVISLITVASYVPYEWDRQVETGKSCTHLWKVGAFLPAALKLPTVCTFASFCPHVSGL